MINELGLVKKSLLYIVLSLRKYQNCVKTKKKIAVLR